MSRTAPARNVLAPRRHAPARRHNQLARLLMTAALIFVVCDARDSAHAKRRRAPAGGRAAVVVDERLSALRESPDFSSNVLRRLGRGRAVGVTGERKAAGGAVVFYRVAVTRRTSGWVQSDALVSPARAGDDARLLRLARGSEEFDRVERAAIFLETFPRSPLRPAALLILGDAAADAAARLSRDASRRLDAREMEAGGAPARTYFLNFVGLDRYRRLGVSFVFDGARGEFQYDGAAWREILRRHPRSREAAEARARLGASSAPAAPSK
ncbi:MAG TPA: hypothetical protein VER32_14140 [Pyrinomonadaceae bacterium]|nr:hypothetical protein [Pyrinomonadaceae bacterium]